MPLSRRRLTTWVLLFALVLASVAPAMAKAWAFAQGHLAPWSVVCTSPADAPMAPADDARHLLEHCAWCPLQHQALAPPPAAVALRSPALQDLVPALFLQAPRSLPAWATAQARAPPTLAG